MQSDFQWFIDHYYEIFEKYGTCYIVIKDEQVHGAYNDFGLAVKMAWQAFEPGTVSVQYCNGNESGYTSIIDGVSPV